MGINKYTKLYIMQVIQVYTIDKAGPEKQVFWYQITLELMLPLDLQIKSNFENSCSPI